MNTHTFGRKPEEAIFTLSGIGGLSTIFGCVLIPHCRTTIGEILSEDDLVDEMYSALEKEIYQKMKSLQTSIVIGGTNEEQEHEMYLQREKYEMEIQEIGFRRKDEELYQSLMKIEKLGQLL